MINDLHILLPPEKLSTRDRMTQQSEMSINDYLSFSEIDHPKFSKLRHKKNKILFSSSYIQKSFISDLNKYLEPKMFKKYNKMLLFDDSSNRSSTLGNLVQLFDQLSFDPYVLRCSGNIVESND